MNWKVILLSALMCSSIVAGDVDDEVSDDDEVLGPNGQALTGKDKLRQIQINLYHHKNKTDHKKKEEEEQPVRHVHDHDVDVDVVRLEHHGGHRHLCEIGERHRSLSPAPRPVGRRAHRHELRR